MAPQIIKYLSFGVGLFQLPKDIFLFCDAEAQIRDRTSEEKIRKDLVKMTQTREKTNTPSAVTRQTAEKELIITAVPTDSGKTPGTALITEAGAAESMSAHTGASAENSSGRGRKREYDRSSEKAGLSVRQLMLAAILLAAGAVLKYFIGSVFSVGMKPNFIIAMYCLAILLIRPRLREAAVIGLLAGAVCQFFPGTPYLNFPSELAGALAMTLLVRFVPQGKFSLMPAICTFFSTVVSGGLFVVMLYSFFFISGSAAAPMAVFGGIILGTAAVNSVFVQLLYLPASAALRLNSAN